MKGVAGSGRKRADKLDSRSSKPAGQQRSAPAATPPGGLAVARHKQFIPATGVGRQADEKERLA